MAKDLRGWSRLCFGFSEPVNRRAYARVGFGLMLAKYLIDALCVRAATGKLWTPVDYLMPIHSLRTEKLVGAPDDFAWWMAVWTLPFLWIGVSMSMRRAVDAGRSAWFGMFFFVPLVNYAMMLALAALPTSRDEDSAWLETEPEPVLDDRFRSALLGIGLSVVTAMGAVAINVYVLESYGSALFIGTPFFLGALSAYLFNHGHPRTVNQTLQVVVISVLMAGGAMLLFALEGGICLAMALPPALLMAIVGGTFGRAIALRTKSPPAQAAAALFLLPGMSLLDQGRIDQPLFEVVSTIEIDAPRERVWSEITSISELPPPDDLLFHVGVAYPTRARLEGSGVGAVRHCEFSTGAFVEPITRWDEPERLSFDVIAQPAPMHEWSFYANVHPPHLDGYLRSKSGEFRLIALEGGRTRVEASTWYELDIHPRIYWRLYTDRFIAAIHMRVLEHVARESIVPL